MVRFRLTFLLLALLAACSASPPAPPRTPALLYDPAHVARARELVIATPGALTSAGILLPVKDWETPTRATAFYRLPGFDGRPAGTPVSFENAAREITALVAANGIERVYFVGFSMGNALNLEAAKRIATDLPHVKVQVAGISAALPNPGPALAGLRGAVGTLQSAIRTGSLDRRTIWLDYYRTLLYGRDVARTPADDATARQIIAARAGNIFVPTRRMGRAHTWDLIHWENPAPERLADTKIHLFHGAEDPVFPLRAARRFAADLPDATLYAYPGDGHLLLITRRDQIFDDIAGTFGLR